MMANMRDRMEIIFQYVASAILALVLFPGQASAGQGARPDIGRHDGSQRPAFQVRHL